MVDIFEECTKNTPGFTNLVYSEQAHCYWYGNAYLVFAEIEADKIF